MNVAYNFSENINKKAKLKAIKGKNKTSNKIFSSNPKKSRLSFSVDSLLKKKFSTRIEEDEEETSEADAASEADEATSGCYTRRILSLRIVSLRILSLRVLSLRVLSL